MRVIRHNRRARAGFPYNKCQHPLWSERRTNRSVGIGHCLPTALHTPMPIRYFISATVIAAMLSGSACGGDDELGRRTLGATGDNTADMQARATESQLPLTAIAALDAGNAAYRAKQMDQAIAHYREATALAPDHVAPWYGVFMAASEMRNTALADSAMARVRKLSSDPAMYEAHTDAATSLVDPPLPAGHPAPQPLPPGHPTSTKPPGV